MSDSLQEIGRGAMDAIADLVAAVELDWDRLDDLRDERDGHDEDESGGKAWAEMQPDQAAELADLEAAAGDCEDQDDADQRLLDDPLCVEYRTGWRDCSEWASGDGVQPDEYLILLTTGGPAVRIVGDLDEHGEPESARLEVQDWGTPWTEYLDADRDILLNYARRVATFAR